MFIVSELLREENLENRSEKSAAMLSRSPREKYVDLSLPLLFWRYTIYNSHQYEYTFTYTKGQFKTLMEYLCKICWEKEKSGKCLQSGLHLWKQGKSYDLSSQNGGRSVYYVVLFPPTWKFFHAMILDIIIISMLSPRHKHNTTCIFFLLS